MRIYKELFPGREIKAQKFFDLTTNATSMIRSPSFNAKVKSGNGGSAQDNNVSEMSKNIRRNSLPGQPRSSSQRRNNSQIRVNKPRNMT